MWWTQSCQGKFQYIMSSCKRAIKVFTCLLFFLLLSFPTCWCCKYVLGSKKKKKKEFMTKQLNTSCSFFSLNPLHPNISMHILHTALYTFPKVLTGRICLPIKRFLPRWTFPFFLMTLVCDSGLILLGEFRCLSLLGFKELNIHEIQTRQTSKIQNESFIIWRTLSLKNHISYAILPTAHPAILMIIVWRNCIWSSNNPPNCYFSLL